MTAVFFHSQSGIYWRPLARLIAATAAAMLALAVLAGWGGGAAMAAEPGAVASRITIRSLDRHDAPRMFVLVTVGGTDPNAGPIRPAAFTVAENGGTVSGVRVEPIFGSPEPVAAVLVLDVSGSMKGRPLADAKAAARTFVTAMHPDDRVAVVSFSDTPRVVTGFTGDSRALLSAIDGLKLGRGTALFDGIALAIKLSGEAPGGQKNIVVLSDGNDTKSRLTAPQAIERVRASRTPVFSVALRSPRFDPATLEGLSRQSGGAPMDAKDSAGLKKLYLDLAREFHNQYRISYRTPSVAGGTLNVKVAVSDQGFVATGSRTFAAISEPAAAAARSAADLPGAEVAKRSTVWPVLAVAMLAYASVTLALLALLPALAPRRNLRRVLDAYVEREEPTPGEEGSPQEGEGALNSIKSAAMGSVEYVARRRGFLELAQTRLEQAGLPLRPVEFMTIHFVFVLGLGLLTQLVGGNLAATVLVVGVGAAVPILVVQVMVTKRQREFQEQLPDTLNMVAGSLRAGYSFLQAIKLVVEETKPPISSEFRRVLAETRFGMVLEESLEKMAERVDVEDFHWTVMAVNIQREVGGNLAEVLEILAHTIQERGRVRRQIKVLTAEGRLSATILIALPFVQVTLLYLFNPGYISTLWTTRAGLAMLVAGLALWGVGIVWLRKIVTIEV